jgi:hypothetical protein
MRERRLLEMVKKIGKPVITKKEAERNNISSNSAIIVSGEKQDIVSGAKESIKVIGSGRSGRSDGTRSDVSSFKKNEESGSNNTINEKQKKLERLKNQRVEERLSQQGFFDRLNNQNFFTRLEQQNPSFFDNNITRAIEPELSPQYSSEINRETKPRNDFFQDVGMVSSNILYPLGDLSNNFFKPFREEGETNRDFFVRRGEDFQDFLIEKASQTEDFFLPSIAEKKKGRKRREKELEVKRERINSRINDFESEFSGKELNPLEFERAKSERSRIQTNINQFNFDVQQFEEREKIFRREQDDPLDLAVGFQQGFINTPFSLATSAIGLGIKPKETLKDIGLGFASIPSQLSTEPFGTAGRLSGEALASSIIFEGSVGGLKRFGARLDPGFKEIKLNRIEGLPSEKGGIFNIDIAPPVSKMSLDLPQQAKFAGRKVKGVSASENFFIDGLDEVKINKQGVGLEKSLFFDPKGRLRVSRFRGNEGISSVDDFLNAELKFSSGKKEALVSESLEIEAFPKNLKGVQKKLLTGRTLTPGEEFSLLKFQLTPSGKAKPVGFLSLEPEVTLAPGERLIKVGKIGVSEFEGTPFDITRVAIKKQNKRFADPTIEFKNLEINFKDIGFKTKRQPVVKVSPPKLAFSSPKGLNFKSPKGISNIINDFSIPKINKQSKNEFFNYPTQKRKSSPLKFDAIIYGGSDLRRPIGLDLENNRIRKPKLKFDLPGLKSEKSWKPRSRKLTRTPSLIALSPEFEKEFRIRKPRKGETTGLIATGLIARGVIVGNKRRSSKKRR